MRKLIGLSLCAVLILGTGLKVLALADEPTAAAIQKLADDVSKTKWEELSKTGADVAKKTELEPVMDLLKLRRPGAKVQGLGVGKVPGAIMPDGIEAKIINLRSNPTVAARDQVDLIRMVEITAAVAATAVHQCPVETKMGQKDPATWKQLSKDMYDGSQDLIKALKANKPGEIKAAAFKLSGSCTNCHQIFRDDK
jgi:hypothetical protein